MQFFSPRFLSEVAQDSQVFWLYTEGILLITIIIIVTSSLESTCPNFAIPPKGKGQKNKIYNFVSRTHKVRSHQGKLQLFVW